MKKRVVITGLGVICAIGGSVARFRDGLFSGECGIAPVSLFETLGFQSRVAAQVKDEFLQDHFLPGEAKRASRCDQLGLIAAREAVSDAGLGAGHEPQNDIGVLLGGGAGGMLSWEQFRRAQWAGKKKPRPSLVLASLARYTLRPDCATIPVCRYARNLFDRLLIEWYRHRIRRRFDSYRKNFHGNRRRQ